jgi:hypothetical protein
VSSHPTLPTTGVRVVSRATVEASEGSGVCRPRSATGAAGWPRPSAAALRRDRGERHSCQSVIRSSHQSGDPSRGGHQGSRGAAGCREGPVMFHPRRLAAGAAQPHRTGGSESAQVSGESGDGGRLRQCRGHTACPGAYHGETHADRIFRETAPQVVSGAGASVGWAQYARAAKARHFFFPLPLPLLPLPLAPP